MSGSRRIWDFVAKRVKESFPARIDMENYHGPQPWKRRHVGMSDMLHGYDFLLKTYGPRADMALPLSGDPQAKAINAAHGIGRTLASYDRWRNRMSPFDRPPIDDHDMERILEAYDKLLLENGARDDWYLPEVKEGYYTSNGISVGCEIGNFMARMRLGECGRTLATYAAWRANNISPSVREAEEKRRRDQADSAKESARAEKLSGVRAARDAIQDPTRPGP
jgi:hypothetical protein